MQGDVIFLASRVVVTTSFDVILTLQNVSTRQLSFRMTLGNHDIVCDQLRVFLYAQHGSYFLNPSW